MPNGDSIASRVTELEIGHAEMQRQLKNINRFLGGDGPTDLANLINGRADKLSAEIADVRSELKANIAAARAEFGSEISDHRHMTAGHLNVVEGAIADLRKDVTSIKSDVSTILDVLGKHFKNSDEA